MTELLAAVPTQVWMLGLLAGAIGGLCVGLASADRAEPRPPTADRCSEQVPSPGLEDRAWGASDLDHDPIWAVAP